MAGTGFVFSDTFADLLLEDMFVVANDLAQRVRLACEITRVGSRVIVRDDRERRSYARTDSIAIIGGAHRS